MYTTPWCPDCRRAKLFLRERGISFREVNIDQDPDGEVKVVSVNDGRRAIPTFEVDGRFFSVSPFNAEKLARELNIPLNPPRSEPTR